MPKSNFSFVKKYIYIFNIKCNNFIFSLLALDKEFNGFYFANLDYFKLNYLVRKNNDILYLLSSTDNLILYFCIEQIDYYYTNILVYSLNGYLRYPTKIYKYDLVCLWYDLGKRFILYFFKYLYAQYTEHFFILKVTGFESKKYNIKIDKNLQLDYFLSFRV